MQITSSDNEKLKTIKRLAQRKHREREGLFVSEGEDLLEAGREAGLTPVYALVAPGSGLEGIECPEDLLSKVSSLGSGTRAIAVWETLPPSPIEGSCVYLHGVGDPGNVGTIVRTTAALTGGTVVLGPGSADALSPRAVRASMGAVFASPPVRAESVAELPSPRVALVAHGGGPPDELEGAGTLCLGAEREGLPVEVTDLCEKLVTIPIQNGGAVESLNVGAAAAIALHSIATGGRDA